jgi:hypothetical protein
MTNENRSPDPIDEPRAYQQVLLGLLGSDDPSEVQKGTAAKLAQLVADAGGDLRNSPEPGEWSVFGCIAHIADAEVMMSARYRWILAHDQPVLMGYDQDLWVDRLHPADEPIDELMAVFRPQREANIALWRRSGDTERARVGLHSERGPESFDLCFRMIAGHDRLHLDQARKTLARVRNP